MTDTSGFSAHPVTGTVIGYRWWDLYLNGAARVISSSQVFQVFPAFPPHVPRFCAGRGQPGSREKTGLPAWCCG